MSVFDESWLNLDLEKLDALMRDRKAYSFSWTRTIVTPAGVYLTVDLQASAPLMRYSE